MKPKNLSRCVCGSQPEMFKGSRGWVTIRCPKCLHRVFGSGEAKVVDKWNFATLTNFEHVNDAPYTWIEKK